MGGVPIQSTSGVLRLERDAWLTVKQLKQIPHEYAPPLPCWGFARSLGLASVGNDGVKYVPRYVSSTTSVRYSFSFHCFIVHRDGDRASLCAAWRT